MKGGLGSARLARAAKMRGAAKLAQALLRKAGLGLLAAACICAAGAGIMFPVALWNGALDGQAGQGVGRGPWKDPQWSDREKRRLFEQALARGEVKAYEGRNGETVLAWRQKGEPEPAKPPEPVPGSEILFRGSCALGCAALGLIFAGRLRAAARRFSKAGGWGANPSMRLRDAMIRESRHFIRGARLRMGRCARAAKSAKGPAWKAAALCKAPWVFAWAGCSAANCLGWLSGISFFLGMWAFWPVWWALAALGPEPSAQKTGFFLWLGAAQAIALAGYGIWRARAQRKLGVGYGQQARSLLGKLAAGPGKGMARLGRKLDEMADRELMARAEGVEILEKLEQANAGEQPGRPRRL